MLIFNSSFSQKWERENAELPRHLQRKPPVKPTATTTEEWNKSAWEASQVSHINCHYFLSSRPID